LFTKATLIDAYLNIHFHPAGTSPLPKIIGAMSKPHIAISSTFSCLTLHKKLVADQHALLIFDNFKGQYTEDLLKLLDENNVSVVLIPPTCTDRLQPLDVRC